MVPRSFCSKILKDTLLPLFLFIGQLVCCFWWNPNLYRHCYHEKIFLWPFLAKRKPSWPRYVCLPLRYMVLKYLYKETGHRSIIECKWRPLKNAFFAFQGGWSFRSFLSGETRWITEGGFKTGAAPQESKGTFEGKADFNNTNSTLVSTVKF